MHNTISKERRRSLHYKKQKRKQKDFCNICGREADLTWDHVPPKCCNNSYRIKVNSWPEGMPKENSYEKEYQSGIKFRSLCSECNNHLLGINYDTALADFTTQIMNVLQSESSVPGCVYIRVKVNRLSRAVCGHILAAKNYYEKDCLVDKQLREYVLNPTAFPPEDFSLLYWVYIYSTIAILRDVVVNSTNDIYCTPSSMISIMNSYPIAYVITSEKDEKCGLLDLFKYCSSDIDEEIELPIDLTSCCFAGTGRPRHFLWPCNLSDGVDGTNFVLGNENLMNGSKIARHSAESVMKIRKR